jgi:S-DNA-T family DNA segregation ATPase FtsK/SpoIIIE
MERRYRLFASHGARNIDGYNAGVTPKSGREYLPYIVVIIDELADIMMLAPDEVERLLCRLAQMARATGIHLVIATQRPSVDVITGLIKANFPARISFAVTSQVDSRVVLDMPGAEKLLGRGDMLYMASDSSSPARLQGVWVSERELEWLINFWKGAAPPIPDAPVLDITSSVNTGLAEADAATVGEDPMLEEAQRIVQEARHASASLLQRKLRVGYARAARLIDLLEERGVVGPAQDGGRSRDVFPVPGEPPRDKTR